MDKKMKDYFHKVQYYETDQMGVVHHSNYIRWFEEARTDFLNQIGFNYREMEEREIVCPVIGISCDYKSMTKFDDTVKISLKVLSFNGIKLILTYEITDAVSGKIRAVGESRHCFLSKEGTPVSMRKTNQEFYAAVSGFIEK